MTARSPQPTRLSRTARCCYRFRGCSSWQRAERPNRLRHSSIKNKETPVTASTDMTIKDVRVTVLRMPWANLEWIKGHSLGPDRGILIVDIETTGGITGMGYLFHFRPGLKSIAMFL